MHSDLMTLNEQGLSLHPAQENIYFDQIINPESSVYTIGFYSIIRQSYDIHILRRAWILLYHHLDALRLAVVVKNDGNPIQYIRSVDTAPTAVEYVDFSSQNHCEKVAHHWMQKRTNAPVDYLQGDSCQMAYIKLSSGRGYLFSYCHHLFFDGIGIYRLHEYLHRLYDCLTHKRSTQWLNKLPQYRTSLSNAQQYLHSSRYQKDGQYWAALLAKTRTIRLPRYYCDQSSGQHTTTISDLLCAQFRNFCDQHGMSVLTLLLSATHIHFTRMDHKQSLLMGTTVHGRRNKQEIGTVGMYANTIPFACQAHESMSFIQYAHAVNVSLKKHFRHSQFPTRQMSSLLDIANKQLFDVVVQYHCFNDVMYDKREGRQWVGLYSENSYQPLQIIFIDHPYSGKLALKIIYSKCHFTQEEICLLTDRLINMMHHGVNGGMSPVSQLPWLLKEELNKLLYTWNQTDAFYPRDENIHQLFAKQAAKNPDVTALVFNGQTITYGQLNQKANQLARAIRSQYHIHTHQSLDRDTLIALYFDRSFEMVISILAVLKAGAAYVPITPQYPAKRTQWIISDTQTAIVLTQKYHLSRLNDELSALQSLPQLLAVDNDQLIQHYSTDNLSSISQPNDLAYVIYTSGTTGQPKGVMIEQHSLVNIITSQTKSFGFSSQEVVIWLPDYQFDASIEQLFLALFNGAQLVIPTASQMKNTHQVQQLICQWHVTHINFTPSYLLAMGSFAHKHCLHRVITGGERCPEALKQLWSNQLINAYGPTETTVTATQCIDYSQQSMNCIGKPINNIRAYVCDKAGQLVPIGVAGELLIGGASTARGYLNRSELTHERFIDNAFATEADKANGYTKLYKTGDIVRWLPNGNLEYLGRNDHQVKIRGFRIELGEIENALSQLGGVKQAVVIDYERDNGEKTATCLAAYVVPESNATIADQHDEWLNQLTMQLPDYMLPNVITIIDKVPLTINGKLDRAALPEPQWVDQDNYVAPRTTLEKQICAIWQEVLGLEQVGIHDNFFRIGGDSIVSIQLVSRLRRAEFQLQVKDVFDAPTVAQLATVLKQSQAQATIDAEQGVLSGSFDLLPIQQWFFEQAWAVPHHWNQAFMLRIPENIMPETIVTALNQLAVHHDMLRCRFITTEKGYQQCYQADSTMAPLQQHDVSLLDDNDLAQLLTNYQSHFDYHQGPLWQAVQLTGYPDGSTRLFFAFHHLIIDSVSWRIIAEDMQALLTGEPLANKTSSYRQWVNAVRQYAKTHANETDYWQRVLAHPINLPTPQDQQLTQVVLSSAQTTRLLKKANAGYHTEINDVLLSALALALRDTFGHATNTITLEGHGREAIDESLDVSKTVGWFTTMYPVQLVVQDELSDTLIQTKEMLRSVPNKGIGFGPLQQQGELDGALPPISFNYLGQLDNTVTNQDNLWQLTVDACGESVSAANQSDLLLNIYGAVQQGILQFSVGSRLGVDQTIHFTKAFNTALDTVIDHTCAQADAGGVKTPSDYPANDLSLERLRALESHYTATGNTIEAIYPANSLQQGFIYHHISQPQDDAYCVQLLLDYKHPLDVAAYQEAWRLASWRYPILRTAFDWDGEPLQIITSQPSLTVDHFRLEDFSHLSSTERECAIAALQVADRTIPFNLSQPGLLRFALIKHSEQYYTVLKTEHHSISDGWSGAILWRTVHHYYQQLLAGRTPDVQPETTYLAVQDYQRQQQNATQAYWETAQANWQGANDINSLLSHALDLSQPPVLDEPAEMTLELQGEAYRQLKKRCQVQGVTVNVALQFAWHKLLQTYTGDDQTIVGTTISGRDIPVDGIESSVGLYINTLPLTLNWENDTAISAQLQALQQEVAALNSHSGIALASLQTGNTRLFHSLFVFENYPNPITEDSDDKLGMSFRKVVEKTDYPLNVVAYEQGAALHVMLCYDTCWLTEEKAKRLLDQLRHILTAIIDNPAQSHQQIDLLSTSERHTLLHTWNQTDKVYSKDKTLYQLFEQQAANNPEATALILDNQTITYAILNQRANQLARAIRAKYHKHQGKALQPDTLIALYLDRIPDMIINILAVLKAGGAYVPIAPQYPKKHFQFILKDTLSPMLMTQQCYLSQLKHYLLAFDAPPTVLSVDDYKLINSYGTDNLLPISQATDLAYVMYTSGTTGQPKGVMISHRNVVSLIDHNRYIDISSSDIFLQLANPNFDASVFEIWGALAHGAQLVIPHNIACSITCDDLNTLIHNHRISILWLTRALFDSLYIQKPDLFNTLRYLLIGGEALTSRLVKKLMAQQHRPQHIINGFGPTEGTVFTTTYLCNHIGNTVSIGKPIDTRKVYVLSQERSLVPIGAPGELYIGGAGIARGYLNHPELTTERFIDNPFTTEEDETNGYTRLYKTGDIVRWLPNGNLEYIGRNDQQVKIRGFRIEPGEIENVLAILPVVKQAIVIDHRQHDQTQLAAYIVSHDHMTVNVNRLRQALADQLPDYMIPDSFTIIDQVPLTMNGKLDRRSLPEPEWIQNDQYIAPDNALEKKLCTIWSKVLHLKKIGINDNFFTIGGNSLLSVSLIADVNAQFNLQLPVKALFISRTIKHLAKVINSAQKNQYQLIDNRLSTKKLKKDAHISFVIPYDRTIVPYPPRNIFLTGVTGFVGAFLLKTLLDNSHIETVYCLVRGNDHQHATEKLTRALQKYRIFNNQIPFDRIFVVDGDLSEKCFGLSEVKFAQLTQSIDSIIHNGASVNFMQSYDDMKYTNVNGTEETLKLACSTRRIPYHFISTLSIFGDYQPTDGFIREDDSIDTVNTLTGGYAQTKWVSEKMVMLARRRGIDANIIRLGRVSSHSKTGIYNRNDIIMRFIESCVEMQLAPDIDMSLDLMPVDYAAKVIACMTVQCNKYNRNYHLLQEKPISFKTMIKLVKDSGINIQILPLSEWINRCEEQQSQSIGPLIDFFKDLNNTESSNPSENSLIKYETDNTAWLLKAYEIVCPTLDKDLLKRYVDVMTHTMS